MLRWEQSWSTRTMRSLEQPVRHTWGKQKHTLDEAAGELPGGLKTTLTKMKGNKTCRWRQFYTVQHCCSTETVKAAVRRSTLFAKGACKSGYTWCFCLFTTLNEDFIQDALHRLTDSSEQLGRLLHERPLCVTKTQALCFHECLTRWACTQWWMFMGLLLPIRCRLLIHSEVCSSHIFFKLWKWTCIAFHLLLLFQHPAALICPDTQLISITINITNLPAHNP